MKEYIEKELLKERFLKWLPPDGDWDYQSMGLHPIENIAVSAIMEIEETPAADVREVIHAKWERVSDWDNENNAIFDCSNCHHGDVQAKGQEVPYCWYCGARMDG